MPSISPFNSGTSLDTFVGARCSMTSTNLSLVEMHSENMEAMEVNLLLQRVFPEDHAGLTAAIEERIIPTFGGVVPHELRMGLAQILIHNSSVASQLLSTQALPALFSLISSKTELTFRMLEIIDLGLAALNDSQVVAYVTDTLPKTLVDASDVCLALEESFGMNTGRRSLSLGERLTAVGYVGSPQNSDESKRTAETTISFLYRQFPEIKSVIDIGCANGSWLEAWQELVQIDRSRGVALGDDVDFKALRICPSQLSRIDVSREPIVPRVRYDLVQCLETAEHLPKTSADHLVAQLCELGDLILFSAATPGQGGQGHINEQPYSYWREKFRSKGFLMFDPLRSELIQDPRVQTMHKYNIFLFIAAARVPQLSTVISNSLIPEYLDPSDLRSIARRLMSLVLSQLSTLEVTIISRLRNMFHDWFHGTTHKT